MGVAQCRRSSLSNNNAWEVRVLITTLLSPGAQGSVSRPRTGEGEKELGLFLEKLLLFLVQPFNSVS